MRTGSLVAIILGILVLLGGIGDLVSASLAGMFMSGLSGGQVSLSPIVYAIPAAAIIAGIVLIALGVKIDHPARGRRKR